MSESGGWVEIAATGYGQKEVSGNPLSESGSRKYQTAVSELETALALASGQPIAIYTVDNESAQNNHMLVAYEATVEHHKYGDQLVMLPKAGISRYSQKAHQWQNEHVSSNGGEIEHVEFPLLTQEVRVTFDSLARVQSLHGRSQHSRNFYNMSADGNHKSALVIGESAMQEWVYTHRNIWIKDYAPKHAYPDDQKLYLYYSGLELAFWQQTKFEEQGE